MSSNAKAAGSQPAHEVPSERGELAEHSQSSSRRKGSTARHTSLAARGEPYVWLTGAGLGAAVLMIVGLLSMVAVRGATTFWPKPIIELTLNSGEKVLGEVTRSESFAVAAEQLSELPEATQKTIADNGGRSRRRLIRTGNYDLYGDDFKWVPDYLVASERTPRDAWLLERREWGPAFGFPEQLTQGDGTAVTGPDAIRSLWPSVLERQQKNFEQVRRYEKYEIGNVNRELEAARLQARRMELQHGEGSAEHRQAVEEAARTETRVQPEFDRLRTMIDDLRADEERYRLVLREANGKLVPESPSRGESPLMVAQVVRAVAANQLGPMQKLGVYLSRWKEFLTDEPREANTEGGVLPAIFGTLLMTLLMSIAVGPLGVLTALYLREYAKQGTLVSAVRIAVNNLAGVPSIVFGVFGLGFFCYVLGGKIDELFYAEKLPSPTFGTGGIMWASLTLALLTVPVVIVATEEALAAVPRSLREGSFACGASKWQTIWRIVIPRAMPGIMTGLILAMARGAGEVAPLMITGVVKLAPELPVDGTFPFLHFERSFMHLGFHIFDVGFQSRNSEAAKPMVFTTTLLLITVIALLNMAAIQLRNRLRRRYKSASF
ncbi:MAG: phosphate ABC transporter permease PstA [Acidobacteriota bacterium]